MLGGEAGDPTSGGAPPAAPAENFPDILDGHCSSGVRHHASDAVPITWLRIRGFQKSTAGQLNLKRGDMNKHFRLDPPSTFPCGILNSPLAFNNITLPPWTTFKLGRGGGTHSVPGLSRRCSTRHVTCRQSELQRAILTAPAGAPPNAASGSRQYELFRGWCSGGWFRAPPGNRDAPLPGGRGGWRIHARYTR